jgi:hypothetical protein
VEGLLVAAGTQQVLVVAKWNRLEVTAGFVQSLLRFYVACRAFLSGEVCVGALVAWSPRLDYVPIMPLHEFKSNAFLLGAIECLRGRF